MSFLSPYRGTLARKVLQERKEARWVLPEPTPLAAQSPRPGGGSLGISGNHQTVALCSLCDWELCHFSPRPLLGMFLSDGSFYGITGLSPCLDLVTFSLWAAGV